MCCRVRSCRRATSATVQPFTPTSPRIASLASSVQRRRRSIPNRTPSRMTTRATYDVGNDVNNDAIYGTHIRSRRRPQPGRYPLAPGLEPVEAAWVRRLALDRRAAGIAGADAAGREQRGCEQGGAERCGGHRGASCASRASRAIRPSPCRRGCHGRVTIELPQRSGPWGRRQRGLRSRSAPPRARRACRFPPRRSRGRARGRRASICRGRGSGGSGQRAPRPSPRGTARARRPRRASGR